ncbi:DNA-formamidopyrimidine glycosylase family protein, partial [Staphylococcus epidermidis]
MPEGDSVFRAAAQLHAALAGQQLISSDFRVPRFATLKLDGWTVTEVVPRGKHLLMRVEGPAKPGGATPAEPDRLTIHSHLKMEGTWQVYP